jgi:hypothetical protein
MASHQSADHKQDRHLDDSEEDRSGSDSPAKAGPSRLRQMDASNSCTNSDSEQPASREEDNRLQGRCSISESSSSATSPLNLCIRTTQQQDRQEVAQQSVEAHASSSREVNQNANTRQERPTTSREEEDREVAPPLVLRENQPVVPIPLQHPPQQRLQFRSGRSQVFCILVLTLFVHVCWFFMPCTPQMAISNFILLYHKQDITNVTDRFSENFEKLTC